MPSIQELVKVALSANRIGTYEQAKGITKAGIVLPLPLDQALDLYAWNAQISAAFMHPLHICEVVVRNGVANAIEAVYGPNWPWSQGFLQSLPNSPKNNLQRELQSARNGQTSAGKVIPELKFSFWQKMFTSRHDQRLWLPHLRNNFPNFPASMADKDCRDWMFKSLGNIRALRNRIAHHEPIFARNLSDDYTVITEVIAHRCNETANWMNGHQQVSSLLAKPPL